MSGELIERVKTLYQRLDKQHVNLIRDVYADDLTFIDPFHHIQGISAFERYIETMYENVNSIGFEYGDTFLQGNSAMLIWTMKMQHSRLNKGQPVVLSGATHLRFEQKVIYHRDYFDAGAMLYEQLPVLRFVIGKIKMRMAA